MIVCRSYLGHKKAIQLLLRNTFFFPHPILLYEKTGTIHSDDIIHFHYITVLFVCNIMVSEYS